MELGKPPEDSAAARRGTELHYLAKWVGDENEPPDLEWIIRENARLQNDLLAQQMKELKIPADAERKEIRDDVRFVMRDENGQVLVGPDGFEFSGTPDRVVIFPKHKVLFIFDFKTGRAQVEAAECNLQLRTYCVMMADEWSEYDGFTVIAAITQPFGNPKATAVKYNKKDIAEAKKEILRIWYSCKSPDAPLNQSISACFFCRARFECEHGQALLGQLAVAKISDIPIPELEAMAEKMDLAKSIVDAYWDRLKHIAETCPGLLNRFELKSTGSLKSIKPENFDKARIVLASEGLLTDEQFKLAAKVSVPELGKLSGDRAKVEQVLTNHGLLEVTEKKPTIAEKKQPKLKA